MMMMKVMAVVRRNVSEVMTCTLPSLPFISLPLLLQLLYSTYLYPSARRSIGVDEEIRRKVYDRLMPAFEELFDEVEEHILNILLQPWTLLLSRDKESFQKVTIVLHPQSHSIPFYPEEADFHNVYSLAGTEAH